MPRGVETGTERNFAQGKTGVAQKSRRFGQPQILEKCRRCFPRAPNEDAGEVFAAHPGLVGDLFHTELFTKMSPAETDGPVEPISGGAGGLGCFLPPVEQEGVGAETDLGAVETGGGGKQAPQRGRRSASTGQRNDRTEFGLEFPEEIARQVAIKTELLSFCYCPPSIEAFPLQGV